MRQMSDTAPIARGNEASRQAADSIQHKLDGIRARVFEHIVRQGARGATGSEISDCLDILPYTAKPRCTELKDAGYIRDSGNLRKNGHDRNETVWVAEDVWPQEEWRGKQNSSVVSGLTIFDRVMKDHPTAIEFYFKKAEIDTIRRDLAKGRG